MQLRFPELRGGPVQGLNDAGVENFQGAIDTYLSRECGQNTGDARVVGGPPARLDFERLTIPSHEIPAFGQLRDTLIACHARWKDKEKEKAFFETALALTSEENVQVLKISDYGTTGLTGGDVDEQGRWFALVKSQGVSIKESTAGGSFGIGKSSPFAASRFRTVFYGTRTIRGDVALQGVCRLVTHRNNDGALTQGVGFIGEYDAHGDGNEPVFRAIRREQAIPTRFRREVPGTDIWVIGYRSGKEWRDDLIRSILTNFWPAIHLGAIQFRVGDLIISDENVDELIQQCAGHEEFEAHQYFKAIASQPLRKRLTHVGDCQLYLTTGSADLPRRICMARSSGMRIYDYQPKACRVPFSGLFICTDPDGNKLLRQLEPPKHDAWDPKRIEGTAGKRALDEIKVWIREEVKKLNPYFTGSSFNEHELAKYLPDIDPDDHSDLPQDQSGEGEEESLEPRPPSEPLTAAPVHARPVVRAKGPVLDGGEGEGDTGGPPHTDGSARTSRRPPGGGPGGAEAPQRLRSRAYHVGDNRYVLYLRCTEPFSGNIRLHAVGEDGTTDPVALKTAEQGIGPPVSLGVSGNRIVGVRVDPDHPMRLAITLDAPVRRSLVAHPTP